MQTTLVLLGGPAAVGKTTLCRELVLAQGIIALDKDEITRAVVEALLVALSQPRTDRESAIYLERVRPVEYQLMERVALACLRSGHSVVADAPWWKEMSDAHWVQRVRELTQASGGSLANVWVTCEPDVNRERLMSRAASRDTGKRTNWPQYLEGVGRFLTQAPEYADIVLDSTTNGPGALAVALLRALA
jgi:predicted kinase